MLEFFPALESQVGALRETVEQDGRAHVVDGLQRSHLLEAVAGRLEAVACGSGPGVVFVRIPRHIDRTAYTVLEMAAQCGARSVAEAMRRDPARIETSLGALGAALGARSLIVDGVDRLERADDELIEVVGEQGRLVHRWIRARTSLTGGRDLEPGAISPQDGPTTDQALWDRVGGRYATFQLAKLRERIVAGQYERCSPEEIARDVWTGISDDIRAVVSLLMVHGRPIDRVLLSGVDGVTPRAIAASLDSALAATSRERLWVREEWSALLWPHVQPQESVLRRRLADGLVRAAESIDASPLAILEAHRHLSELGELARATRFAQYGALLLLDLGRRASLAERLRESVAAYDAALDVDARLRGAAASEGIGAHARAYAVHYRAYNRYKSGAHGSPLETLGSYREALGEWPERALFWSRTIASAFVAGHYEEAIRARDEALRRVPQHANKAAVLVWRTVEKLLDRGLVLAALLVSDGHHAATSSQRAVEERLRAHTGAGWPARDLWAPGIGWLRFTTQRTVRVRGTHAHWSCSIADFEGPPAERPGLAVARAFSALVEEAIELHCWPVRPSQG